MSFALLQPRDQIVAMTDGIDVQPRSQESPETGVRNRGIAPR